MQADRQRLLVIRSCVPAIVRWSRSGGPGRLHGSGDAPCFGQAEKRGLPRRLQTGTFQFRTRVAFVLQGPSYSNKLSSGLPLRQVRCLCHGTAFNMIRHVPCCRSNRIALPRGVHMRVLGPYDQAVVHSKRDLTLETVWESPNHQRVNKRYRRAARRRLHFMVGWQEGGVCAILNIGRRRGQWRHPRDSRQPASIPSNFRFSNLNSPYDDVDKKGALARLDVLSRGWREILPGEQLRHLATRLLDIYELRAADSLQLAAALTWCQERPSNRNFVCGDERLSKAAESAGFSALQLSRAVP